MHKLERLILRLFFASNRNKSSKGNSDVHWEYADVWQPVAAAFFWSPSREANKIPERPPCKGQPSRKLSRFFRRPKNTCRRWRSSPAQYGGSIIRASSHTNRS